MGKDRIFHLFPGDEEQGFVDYSNNVLECFILIGRNVIKNKVKFCNSFKLQETKATMKRQ